MGVKHGPWECLSVHVGWAAEHGLSVISGCMRIRGAGVPWLPTDGAELRLLCGLLHVLRVLYVLCVLCVLHRLLCSCAQLASTAESLAPLHLSVSMLLQLLIKTFWMLVLIP